MVDYSTDQYDRLPELEDVLQRSRKYGLLFMVIWICVLVLVGLQDYFKEQKQVRELAMEAAQANFMKEQAFRLWASSHGGVYVPATERTPPNPYLEHIIDEQNIITGAGRRLTLMNPAYMMRQILQEHGEMYGISGKITSQQLINPINAPDQWEREALQQLAQGAEEVVEFVDLKGESFLRFIRPMIATEGCLKCHAHQGYKAGEICGGLSLVIPLARYQALARQEIIANISLYLVVGLLGMVAIFFFMKNNYVQNRRRYDAIQELLAGEQRFRNLVENLKEVVFQTDAIGLWTFLSPAWVEITGFSLQESLGKVFLDFVLAEDRQRNMELFESLIECRKEFCRHEIRYRRKDGGSVWMEVFARLTYDEENIVSGTTGTLTDISARKEAEDRLRNSNAILENIFSGSNFLIAYMDRDFNFIKVNRAYAEADEKEPGFFVGKNHFDLYPNEENKMIFQQVVDSGELYTTAEKSFQYQHAPEREESFWDWSLQPIMDSFGTVEALVMFLVDVTRRVQLESQVRQIQKMETIGTLAGGIAHDFNNILMPILGYSQIARENIPPEDRDTIECLEQVEISAQRAKELVGQLLVFSHQREQERKPLLLKPIIKETIKLLRSTLPVTITIQEHITDDCGPVMADPSQMHQVIMNLCTNGYQAMGEEGGVLSVSLDCVDSILPISGGLSLAPKRKYARITVADTGPGMDLQTRERIFEPFYTTKHPGQGTGLGLAVVHGIVTSHDGQIMVESEVGKGSVFYVFLPQLEVNGVLSAKGGEEEVKGHREHILLVDDDQAVLALTQRILEQLGYLVVARRDGIEALELFRKEPARFDLVITDQIMPKMSGSRLVCELFKIRDDIPVILMTGMSEEMDRESSLGLGFTEFMYKPMTRQELSVVVRRVLEGKDKR